MTTAGQLAAAPQAFRGMVVNRALHAASSVPALWLRIAGITIQLNIADPELDSALMPALRHHLCEPTSAPIVQLVAWSTPLGPFPWGPSHLGRGGSVAGLSHGPVRTCAAPDETSLVLWDSERRLACCWFAGAGGVTRWDRAAPFRTALHFALSGRRHQLIHSAAVGSGGRGALLAGPGGSGKSTTTMACLLAGLQVVGDDYSVIELGDGRARAWNLYNSIKVGERGPADRDDRRTLIVGDDLPGASTDFLDVAAILLPRVVNARHSTLTPTSSAEALRALAPSTLLQAPAEGKPSLGLLADLARAAPAYHLNLGADRGVPAIAEVVAA
ncbi:hypothetical protein FHT44_000571 [Mycolicibacterium sp. BK634]|uniref:hypothetical protein n=1 Tax=Mycolicibacterium sp. BK634 TaxID=2587099 RepID=UPI001622C733|nr:hypothetical protein [Mycolicibacterium sp. BK634]MBB3748110.1 hypothetical protein [Mycolicibacterium sp. BK634]